MKKRLCYLLFAIAVAISGSAYGSDSGNETDYEAVLKKGIAVGMQFERNRIKQELMDMKLLMDEVFNYRYLLLAGDVPPPVVIDETVVKKGSDGVARLERRLSVLPPAYFPVDRIVSLRKKLSNNIVTIPGGHIVYIDTKNMPLEDVAFSSFLARTDGFSPVYIDSKNMLIFGSFTRKADAESAKRELTGIGLFNVKVAKLDSDLRVEVPDQHKEVADQVRELANSILAKERKLYGIDGQSFQKGIPGVLAYLQKALAAVDTINTKKYGKPAFNVAKLREDINAIINHINLFLAERQPYMRVISVPEARKAMLSKDIGTGKLNKENEKYRSSTPLKHTETNIEEIRKLLLKKE